MIQMEILKIILDRCQAATAAATMQMNITSQITTGLNAHPALILVSGALEMRRLPIPEMRNTGAIYMNGASALIQQLEQKQEVFVALELSEIIINGR